MDPLTLGEAIDQVLSLVKRLGAEPKMRHELGACRMVYQLMRRGPNSTAVLAEVREQLVNGLKAAHYNVNQFLRHFSVENAIKETKVQPKGALANVPDGTVPTAQKQVVRLAA